MRLILGFCALAIIFILYESLVAIPRENAEQATSQQMIQEDERSACASEAENTAIAEYKSTYCWPGNLTTQCSNGTYLTAQYDSAYSSCLQHDGLSY